MSILETNVKAIKFLNKIQLTPNHEDKFIYYNSGNDRHCFVHPEK